MEKFKLKNLTLEKFDFFLFVCHFKKSEFEKNLIFFLFVCNFWPTESAIRIRNPNPDPDPLTRLSLDS